MYMNCNKQGYKGQCGRPTNELEARRMCFSSRNALIVAHPDLWEKQNDRDRDSDRYREKDIKTV